MQSTYHESEFPRWGEQVEVSDGDGSECDGGNDVSNRAVVLQRRQRQEAVTGSSWQLRTSIVLRRKPALNIGDISS